MDRASYAIISRLGLSDVHLIALEDFERGDKELLGAKKNRTLVEYYFTCTPSLPLFILNNYSDVELITYLDADLFFFSNPAEIFKEIADYSIAIIEHRFPLYLRSRERYGIYNVGWLSFRHDGSGLACLRWWRNQCIEWCHDWYENDRFADQKYLDQLPSLFRGLVVLRHKGANLAPWNLANYIISWNEESVWVDEQLLVFFHFQGVIQIRDWLYDSSLAFYRVKPSLILRQRIYGPYVRELAELNRKISFHLQRDALQVNTGGKVLRTHYAHINLMESVIRKSLIIFYKFRGVLSRNYISVVNGRIIQ